MLIVEKVLKRRIRELVNIKAMQFGLIPGRGTTDTMLVSKEYKGNIQIKKKVVYTFLDIEKAFVGAFVIDHFIVLFYKE